MAQQRRIPGESARRKRPEKNPPKQREQAADYSTGRIFNRKKFMLQLATVAAVALAIAIGLSIFFKVDTVSVSGLEKYGYDRVVEASGIQKGDSLVFFSRAEVSSKILQSLPYIHSVRVGITLPGTVKIIVEEVEVAYAVQDAVDSWWLISAAGTVLEQTDAADAAKHTVVQGVRLRTPVAGQKAVAAEQTPDSDTPVTVTGADRLEAALQILQALEKNAILGDLSKVDVSALQALQLWHGKDYCFLLGDSTDLSLKIAYVKGALPQILQDYPAGTLDVSNPGNSGGFPFTERG